MTISVRLSKEIETLLREEARKNDKNISDIVNDALQKYHNEYKYFESINAHHLDPIVVEAFFSLIDTPEKADRISTAG
ncbi:MAG: ribbon-helix-helix protein, CopG family, partial [Candidatus Nitrosopelagicus sp.]|nr:ribbon-helix-helix protein, CopG family [Candidatus Nitrosopelagicus sp.]